MFETSKDILYLALALSAVIFTFFVCWALYYIVMMLKKTHAVINEVTGLISSIKEKLERLEGLFNSLEEKIKNSANYLPLVFKGVTELVTYLKGKKENKRKTKKTKSAE